MKIGIMTCWGSGDNYGQQLQCYALQKYLKQLGHDAYLIRYDKSMDSKRFEFSGKVLRKLKRSYKVFIPEYWKERRENKRLDRERTEISSQIIHLRNFKDFREKNLSLSKIVYSSYRQLRDNPPEADMYVTGSDQVWHFSLSGFGSPKEEMRAYMLDFGGKEIIRISAAASWGRTEIPTKWKRHIKPLLHKFNTVTVREASAIELCRQCGKDAVLVPDPTLYLEAETYRSLYEKNEVRKPAKDYVMVYWVNNGGHPPMEEIRRWSKERKLEIEYVTGNGMLDKYPQNYATVQEWLYLVDHAQYIITNSFHACVFSLIFKKRFGAIKINGQESGMNDRLASLFDICNVTPRYISATNFACLDWEAETVQIDQCVDLKEAIRGWVNL